MSAPIVHFPTPVSCDLDFSPVEVARGLRHLPGLVFLDTSGADFEESRPDANHSLIAARPVRQKYCPDKSELQKEIELAMNAAQPSSQGMSPETQATLSTALPALRGKPR